jgi:hypothetical protein
MDVPLLPDSRPRKLAAISHQLPTLLTIPKKAKVKVTLRLAVGLGIKPLETHDLNHFHQLNPCGDSPYVTSSVTRIFSPTLTIITVFHLTYSFKYFFSIKYFYLFIIIKEFHHMMLPPCRRKPVGSFPEPS